MTLFEVIFPLGALFFAGLGIAYIRHEDRKLDERLAKQKVRQDR